MRYPKKNEERGKAENERNKVKTARLRSIRLLATGRERKLHPKSSRCHVMGISAEKRLPPPPITCQPSCSDTGAMNTRWLPC